MYPFFETSKSGDKDFFSSGVLTNFNYPPHLHPYVEIVYVLEGTIDIVVNDISHSLNVGDIAVCFPNDIHSFSSKVSSKILLFLFSPQITGSYFSKRMDKTLENPFIQNELIDDGISSLFLMLKEEFNNCNNRYVIKGLLYTILGKLDRYFTFKEISYSYNSVIQNVLRYIELHYNENISLDGIAKALGFSKFYLSRIFSQKIGYQFNDYINRLRINKAEKLLSETELSITNIALECGFESQRNFNRSFKKLTSLTPTEFRINWASNT